MSIIDKYRQFRSKYVIQERRKEEYLFNKYYAHLVDPFFTKLAYDLKLKPNTVTIISGLIGVASGISFILEKFIIAGILLQLHHLMDGADGNLARLTNQTSEFGAKLDKFTDQVVRFIIFIGIIIAANAPITIDIIFLLTFILDILVVRYFVLPFMKQYDIIRAKWKQWFLNRGIIPAFDIFTIYFVISLFAILNKVDLLIYILIVMKNIDWIYRVWECLKTYIIHVKKKGKLY